MSTVINWLDVIDSTNSEAFRQKDSSAELTVWAAEFQTNGRGQKGNSWESAKGKNMTFTILLKPTFLKAEDQFIISQIVTMSIKEYMFKKGIDVTIKWPNDIYALDNKICGILIEHFLSGANLSDSIVGIGINMNQTSFDSDAPNPTSMAIESNREYDKRVELEELCSIIESRYKELKAAYEVDSFKAKVDLDAQYYDTLYRRDGLYYYEDLRTGERFKAKIKGIDKYSCLILEKEDGSIDSYAFKEVKYILFP